jgi:hypothetical protein
VPVPCHLKEQFTIRSFIYIYKKGGISPQWQLQRVIDQVLGRDKRVVLG